MERQRAQWALPALAVVLVGTVAAVPATRGIESPAQQTGSRIAYVNSQFVLQQTPGYAMAESTYAREFQSFQREVQRLRDQLDSNITAYQQRSIGLSQADRQAKEAEIRQMQQQLETRSNALRTRADERERELVSPLEERIKAVIEGLRAERNLSIIFDVAAPGNGIIAADRALDLTPQVVQRLRQTQQQ